MHKISSLKQARTELVHPLENLWWTLPEHFLGSRPPNHPIWLDTAGGWVGRGKGWRRLNFIGNNLDQVVAITVHRAISGRRTKDGRDLDLFIDRRERRC